MTKFNIKGYEISIIPIKNTFDRRAQQYKNNIIANLRKLGLTVDDIELELEPAAIKKVQASVGWYFENEYLYYSFNRANNYAENLQVISKVIELEINALINETKSVEDFICDFSEEQDIEEIRKNARKTLGIDENSTDIEEINKKYKDLSKELHPDMPNGCLESFKKINTAHKTLKKELL